MFATELKSELLTTTKINHQERIHMNAILKDARSTIKPENIQEVLDAASSSKQALQGGQQQYLTPKPMAEFFAKLLPDTPAVAFDPQCAAGNTVIEGFPYYISSFGFEIDNQYCRSADTHDRVNRVIGNCVKAYEALDELYPDIGFECQNANPPFGMWWNMADGSRVDSTDYTWRKIRERAAAGGYGYFIANWKTIERLGIHNHQWVYLYQKFPVGVWKQCEVEIGVVHWHNSTKRAEKVTLQYSSLKLDEHKSRLQPILDYYANQSDGRKIGTSSSEIREAFSTIQEMLDEERKNQPNYNVYLKGDRLQIYLSTRVKMKRKITNQEVLRLQKIHDSHPLTMTVDRETRMILKDLVDCGLYTIEPKALEAMTSALAEVNTLSIPIMPVTDFSRVAYCDEEDALQCINDFVMPFEHGGQRVFTSGKSYPIKTSTYKFTNKFFRNKLKYSETENRMYTDKHECSLSGCDRYIQVEDDNGEPHRFMANPVRGFAKDHDESLIWQHFAKPEVKTVSEAFSESVEKNRVSLETCELFGGYTYYPGQKTYISRVACKDNGLVGADTGVGKSLIALSLIQLKAPQRALIIAPQGTMKAPDSDDDVPSEDHKASQWITEIRTFAPGQPVFELFSMDDYERILKANGGQLPCGIFVTYYEAFFINKARESLPESWTDANLERLLQTKLPKIKGDDASEQYYCRGVGKEVNGIRCIVQPSMATVIGHHFDFIALDEAHRVCHLSSTTSQTLIRLQPKYRYALTATPIPNTIGDLFSLLGWLCVPNWYRYGIRNAAFPYARENHERFIADFQSVERDHTEERIRSDEARRNNSRWSGKVEKVSPIISSPARLLKLITPTMAYISKQSCNPNLPEPKITEVRVAMGKEQSLLYGFYMNRGNIPHKNPKIRAGLQGVYLQNICADPAGFEHGGPKVNSNFNPKTIAILELMRDFLKKGQQVVVACSRVGQNNTLADRLRQAGIKFARIDSTIAADQHAYNSNIFKSGDVPIMLMGSKCAVGHSFSQCPNLIIGSIEYSYGSLHQVKGRVDRVNSKYQPNIFCVLHEKSIEEVKFEIVATKRDAATICLQGQRVPVDFKPVDPSEIMAEAFNRFSMDGSKSEMECEAQWPALRDALATAV